MDKKAAVQMIHLTIDGQDVTVPKGTTVYTAAQQIGIDIPIFCYHDRMPPFGACRMCLVEVEKMPKLQTSCTLQAQEGMVVKTQTKWAVDGRNGIVEFLLINHPLDCPICDRGGECPLQENTMDHGPGKSRFYEQKRRFRKPIRLGSVLTLDRERCIVCARCTRFGDVIAGDHALEFIDRGFKTEVGTPDGRPVKSKFIGNTIRICPVGALTSDVYRFRARPWDNDSTPSTCPLCPVGCSLILDSRDGEIVRTLALENRDVNDIWLCDKGWFGYEFTYHPERLSTPLIRRNGQLEKADWEEALSLIASKIAETKDSGKVGALGGNTLTIEENYLFQRLMREVVGTPHLDHRVGMPIIPLEEEGLPPGMEMSIGDCEELSFAIFFGLDLTEEFPLVWLRLRQAINKCEASLFFFGHFTPEIAPYFAKTVLHPPGEEIEILKQHLSEIEALAEKKDSGAIFVGKQYLASPYRKAFLTALAELKEKFPHLSLNIMEGRGNSMGARYAGMRPEFGPFNERVNPPGLDAHQMLKTAASEGWKLLYVAGANPATQLPSKLWKETRDKLDFLVVQDLFLTETAQQADVVLPTYAFVEKKGSFMNIEGRIQKLQPGKELPEGLYSDAEIFVKLGQKLDYFLEVRQNFLESLVRGKRIAQPPRILQGEKPAISKEKKQDHVLLATFAHALFDHGVRMRHDPHTVQLAMEPKVRIHPEEAFKHGIRDGETVTLVSNDNALSAKIQYDKGVAMRTAVLPLGFEEIPVRELGLNLLNGMSIQLRKRNDL